ncbi:MAG: type II secretion system protein GspL [Pseudomonadota bacterium]
MLPGSLSGLIRTRRAVCVSLGTGGLRGLRLCRTGDKIEVEGSVYVEFPPDRQPHPAEVESALNQVKEALLDERTRLVTNIRTQEAGIHFITLPFDRPEKMLRVLPYEAESLFLTPVEELILDYLPLPRGMGHDRKGVVFGAKPESVALILETLAAAGMEPDSVLPDRLGLLMAGIHLLKNTSDRRVRLFLDLGAQQTGLALFQGPKPVMVRSIFFGGRDLTRTLAEEAGLDLFEAEQQKRETSLAGLKAGESGGTLLQAWQTLLLEIERTLAGAGLDGDDAPPLLILGGGGALTPGLESFLADRLGLEVTLASSVALTEPGLNTLESDAISAFGLALLAVSPGHLPNLRQGDLAPRRLLARHKGSLVFMAAGLVLALLLNLSGLLYAYRLENHRYQAARAEISRVFLQTVPGLTKVVAPLEQLRQEIVKMENAAAGLSPVSGRALDVLLDISAAAGAHPGLRITTLSLNPKNVDLQGEGGSYEVVDQFKAELARLPHFSEATLGGARVDATTKVVTFKISLKRKT